MASSPPEIAALQQENARLIALLQAHGIEWRLPPELVAPTKAAETSRLTTDGKVALFRRLFHGRTDIYPVRWESKTSGKSGYSPACTNEWRAGICEKPRIKCGDCSNRLLAPLSGAVIYNHLAGVQTIGVYPFDRLFPNQDAMPKGGFGNLIALPLQKRPREQGFSVFVDANLAPNPDQWAFLDSIQPMEPQDIEPTILRAVGGVHPLDVTFIDDEDLATPWKRETTASKKLTGQMPRSFSVTLANQLYFEKAQLPQALANRLIRLAAFQNPEFYRAQAMRMSVWDKPRVIGCAENYPQHIALPRGCFDAATALLADNSIRCDLKDERTAGGPIDIDFAGTLRLDQEAAVSAMLHYDTGVLCAPTAFGKTVTAAAIIVQRGINTFKTWQAGPVFAQPQ